MFTELKVNVFKLLKFICKYIIKYVKDINKYLENKFNIIK
jgi:hypothetical protein